MKTILTALLMCASWSIVTGQNKAIHTREGKVTQLIFPTTVKSFKGGFLPTDFAISAEDNVIYIQPLGSFPESNMNIITTDGYYYTFTISYDTQAEQYNYIFTPVDAIYKDGASLVELDRPTPIEHVEELKPMQKEVEIEGRSEMYDAICKQILRSNGYLLTRNGVKMKGFSMLLKGVYVDNNTMFVRVLLENTGNIIYDIETLTFYVEAFVKGKASTQEKTQLFPTYIYNNVPAVNARSAVEIICCFDKFTISNEKILYISVIEKNGERNLNLEVNNNIILEARKYE